jgi:hypothetical protein
MSSFVWWSHRPKGVRRRSNFAVPFRGTEKEMATAALSPSSIDLSDMPGSTQVIFRFSRAPYCVLIRIVASPHHVTVSTAAVPRRRARSGDQTGAAPPP